MKNKIVAIDLDGTIAEPFTGDWNRIENPRPFAKEALDVFKSQGWRIIIHTCRPHKELIENYLSEHNIPFDAINMNPWDESPHGSSPKPYADFYIDDAVWPYCGRWFPSWGEIIADLQARGILNNPDEEFLKLTEYAANFYGETCKR